MKEKFLNSPHAYLIENSPMELLNDRECVLYSLKNKFESWRIIYEKNPSDEAVSQTVLEMIEHLRKALVNLLVTEESVSISRSKSFKTPVSGLFPFKILLGGCCSS